MVATMRRFDSSDLAVSKYVFEFPGAIAEAVLYRYPDWQTRTVICCSTQSGCRVGCTFCGTGKRFVRSLTSGEILEQVAAVFRDAGIDTSKVGRLQVMFMSMGEPMLNWRAVEDAIKVLHALHPNAELLVSTSAPRVSFEWLTVLSQQIAQVGLQFSVHESTDAARDRLIPYPHKLTLREIAETGEMWASRTGRRPFFNYCAHAGNVSAEDADRLRALFDPSVWRATVSVVCAADETVAGAVGRQEALVADFAGLLLAHGFDVRVFNPAGQDDIGGGCGQLWYVQKWMRDHGIRTKEATW